MSIFQFGIVSFFNVLESEILTIKAKLKPFGRGDVTETLTEDISVKVIPNTSEVSFNSVTISELNEEMYINDEEEKNIYIVDNITEN